MRPDSVRWFGRLRRSDALVLPVGDDGGPIDPPGGWLNQLGDAAEHTAADRPWNADVTLVRGTDGFELGWSLWCCTAEHVQRVSTLSRQVLRAQIDLVQQSVRRHGGRVTAR